MAGTKRVRSKKAVSTKEKTRGAQRFMCIDAQWWVLLKKLGYQRVMEYYTACLWKIFNDLIKCSLLNGNWDML